ncbi:MAG TPA: glucose 1-dehydrogenase [Chitinophaga sp.]|uniref:SDR family NAD(P)-dependent oxidoreductase n=1 Tax=Chitinophaga sp. TaxID=1869181 RepID=UPI002B62B83B|nr:glucose 1-dehydrogenase [Chitinophaga sp.]HVI46385.1 glucose 1-dehydrogenase [Chitinophaga sp.]
MYSLKNQVAIVTGVSTGIGRSVAQLFAENGARLVLAGRDREKSEALQEEITGNGGDAIFIPTDVSRHEDCRNLVEKTLEHYGKLDIACNNAGIGNEPSPVAEHDIELWQRIINTNLSGVFYCMRYQIPAMLQQGSGSIINIASVVSQVALPGISAYVSSKHGLLGLTRTAALEYSAQGIRINAVGPAYIATPMLANIYTQEVEDKVPETHPIGRIGRPEEVAELVLWLASSRASFVTGAYYPIDGGYLAR